jgi:hypothetical protein
MSEECAHRSDLNIQYVEVVRFYICDVLHVSIIVGVWHTAIIFTAKKRRTRLKKQAEKIAKKIKPSPKSSKESYENKSPSNSKSKGSYENKSPNNSKSKGSDASKGNSESSLPRSGGSVESDGSGASCETGDTLYKGD